MARSRAFRRASLQRPTFWEGAVGFISLPTGTSAALTLVSEASLENTPNATLVRTRGTVVAKVSAGTAPVRAHFAWGARFVTAPALAAGVASLPVPIRDIGSDWPVYGGGPLLSVASALTDADSSQMLRWEVDSKSMRKAGLNQVLVFVAEQEAVTGTLTVDVMFFLRLLFKR